MLRRILLNLIPFKNHRELNINYSRIYSTASGVKPVDRKNPIPNVADLKALNLKIRRFVIWGFEWCEENLGRAKEPFTIKINYTYSRTFGTYFFYNKLFVIRVWDDQKLTDLIEAIIHEYIHYLQFKSEQIMIKSEKLHDKLDYENNPYEIETRIISNKLKQVCFNSLMAKL